MPTTQPRYTVTDTGALRATLDLAQRRWPEIEDRKQLLLRLVALGAEQLTAELDRGAVSARRERQRAALRRAPTLVDVELLRSDAAWR